MSLRRRRRASLRDTTAIAFIDSHAATDTSVPVSRRSPDANAVAGAWNSLQTIRSKVVDGSRLVTRLPEFNCDTLHAAAHY